MSAGNLGFKKAQRGTYDAAYQLASHVFAKLEEKRIRPKSLEVVLRDFGEGREAAVKALLGTEGRNLKGAITRVTDATRLKFGGTRSKAPRRLVGELIWLVTCGMGGLTLLRLGINSGGLREIAMGWGWECSVLCYTSMASFYGISGQQVHGEVGSMEGDWTAAAGADYPLGVYSALQCVELYISMVCYVDCTVNLEYLASNIYAQTWSDCPCICCIQE